MKHESDRPISVEDLLRLKRAERPPSDFWDRFDRRLREKQLSALVEPKPWWRSSRFAELWQGFSRFQVPLGVTAILAVTLGSWQYDRAQFERQPEAVSVVEPVLGVSAGNLSLSGATVVHPGTGSVALAAGPDLTNSDTAPGGVDTRVAVNAVEASAATLPRDIPLLGVPSLESRESSTPWSARLEPTMGVQNELAEVQLSRSLLSSVARFEARLPAARSPVEPLKQITPPAERRGARILTAMVTVGSVENAMRTTERAASRLSEERLYDQIQRFGARGAGVSVKF